MTTIHDGGVAVPAAPGVPGPALGRLATMPGVNLMPPEIAERAALAQVKGLCIAGLVVAVAAVGGLYYQAHTGVTSAQSSLAAAGVQQSAAQTKVAQLQPVATTYTEVAAAKTEVAEALSGRISWSSKLNDLSLSIPPTVWLTNMTLSSGGNANGALANTGIDTITFTGFSELGPKQNGARDGVAAWLDSLVAEKGYTNPYVSTTAETAIGGKVFVGFSSTVTVTTAALEGLTNATSSGS